MILDKSYFNSIRLDTIRKKYYDADTVDRLLVDIRSKADAMNREYVEMKAGFTEAEKAAETLREENEDLRRKGQTLSQEILSLREDLRAAQQQGEVLQEGLALQERTEAQQSVLLRRFEALLSEEKEAHQKAVERLNERWKELLGTLGEADITPEDLGDKIGMIAQELREIEEL